MHGWRFAIDRGGTFTDLLALSPDGRRHALKLLSSAPEQYADAVLEGIRRLTQWPRERSLAEAPIASVRLGTTVATNALLERRGAKVGLILTEGFRDLLEIGDQSRSDLFDLKITKPTPLYQRVATVAGRVAADGSGLHGLDLDALARIIDAWLADGVEAVAISFMHGWRFPDFELRAEERARELGVDWVVCGHRASPATRYLDRTHTAVVDAYLTPIIRRYVDGLESQLGQGRLLLMQSDGALVPPAQFRGATAVLSGPAGGASACAVLSAAPGTSRSAEQHTGLIGFDMGGTSTDVCLAQHGTVARSWREVAGARLGLPMLEVHTVAAGGGSIIDFIDGQLCVGPGSAGADPGPACYGRGGPVTITDANLILGRLHPPDLPQVFGQNGTQPICVSAARMRMAELAESIVRSGGPRYEIEALAAGAVALANESMAQAVHGLTSARGIDPSGLTLNGFGGAAGQHLCGVADKLAVTRLCLHPYAGVLSAWGIGISAEGRYAELPLEMALEVAALQRAQQLLADFIAQRPTSLQSRAIETRCQLRTRLRGGGDLAFSLPLDQWERLDVTGLAELLPKLQVEFGKRFHEHFGYLPPNSDCELVALLVEENAPAPDWAPGPGARQAPEAKLLEGHDGLRSITLAYYRDGALTTGQNIAGPALVSHPLSTLYLAPDWQMRVDPQGLWVLTRSARQPTGERQLNAIEAVAADPVRLALYHHRFMHVAEQMGEVLRSSARSVNIRERLDYSCALFDAQGQLIANAPHMPVHLGSMGESVRAVLDQFAGSLAPGNAYILNDPYRGGTHLPDITVVSPAFGADGALLALFASRAHHADVGGISPGSMPAASRSVAEEGVLIAPTQIVAGGKLLRDRALALFTQGHWPSRNPELNVGEVEAQLAANQRGIELFRGLLQAHGSAEVNAYLKHVLDHTEGLLRERMRSLGNGRAAVQMDQGLTIQVAIEIDQASGGLTVDFSGTSAQSADNYNAPSAVVRAAALYVLRCLLAHPVPLNEGFARPLTLRLPSASLVSPEYPAAVVAGNVETSQAITDALLLALGAAAASQGTMNNLSFGNSQFQYYETICGGAGAGPGFAGASAVHTHMTNSRITDPEVLERRFPVRLEQFEVRADSGGWGRWAGGNGVLRRIRFDQAVELSILANRRRHRPPGLQGGSPGSAGLTRVIRQDGSVEELSFAQSIEAGPGDAIEVQTPGGGGFGSRG
ncbi:MAG: hydantoinase B/oxoprolinase family protein [Xanthomonadales bacterium]|nr:hydantoinase B/oxoprolinase family protein [Xanthomonadales bacterium]